MKNYKKKEGKPPKTTNNNIYGTDDPGSLAVDCGECEYLDSYLVNLCFPCS